MPKFSQIKFKKKSLTNEELIFFFKANSYILVSTLKKIIQRHEMNEKKVMFALIII